jgi:hypothetical protein
LNVEIDFSFPLFFSFVFLDRAGSDVLPVFVHPSELADVDKFLVWLWKKAKPPGCPPAVCSIFTLAKLCFNQQPDFDPETINSAGYHHDGGCGWHDGNNIGVPGLAYCTCYNVKKNIALLSNCSSKFCIRER